MSEDLRKLLQTWVKWFDSKWEDKEFVPPIDETRAALSEPSPPDVQNVPDVWRLLKDASDVLCGFDVDPPQVLVKRLDAALAQRDRFVLVPKEPTTEQWNAVWDATGTDAMRHMRKVLSIHDIRQLYYEFNQIMLAALPKPEGKP